MGEFGFELRRADGSLAVTSRETLLRLVHIQRIGGSFTGSFTVPDFDATETNGVFTGKGFFYAQKVMPARNARTSVLPTLDWNNDTKTMSVTAVSLPPNWPPGQVTSPYDIIFMHFR